MVNPFHLVSMPGEVKDHTQMVTSRGLHVLENIGRKNICIVNSIVVIVSAQVRCETQKGRC